MKVTIVSLLESSWYGDFQILLDVESSFQLVAADYNHKDNPQFKGFVHILSLKRTKLVKLCKMNPDWNDFLVIRASHRRSWFMQVLEELQNEVEL